MKKFEVLAHEQYKYDIITQNTDIKGWSWMTYLSDIPDRSQAVQVATALNLLHESQNAPTHIDKGPVEGHEKIEVVADYGNPDVGPYMVLKCVCGWTSDFHYEQTDINHLIEDEEAHLVEFEGLPGK